MTSPEATITISSEVTIMISSEVTTTISCEVNVEAFSEAIATTFYEVNVKFSISSEDNSLKDSSTTTTEYMDEISTLPEASIFTWMSLMLMMPAGHSVKQKVGWLSHDQIFFFPRSDSKLFD